MSQGKNSAKKSGRITDLPAIDWNLCIRLANHKVAVAQEILALVVEQLPADLQAIQQAQAKADYTEQLRLVHKLHGALCYSGMPGLKEAVAKLEMLLKDSVLDEAKLVKLSRQVEVEVERVLASPRPCE